MVYVCRSFLQPLDSPTSTPIAPLPITQYVEMGQGLESIPHGSNEIQLLNLAYNHLSSLPEYIFTNSSYKSLTTIDLSQNKINTIHPTAFRGLKNLSTVILTDNNVTSLDVYSFRYNLKLTKLDLSRNRLNFNRLRVFLVSQNLETLILKENRIEQIYELTFLGLPNLKYLNMDGNLLFMIAQNSFRSLNKLQYLSLANTGVYRLSQSMFGNNLPRIIDLEETPLSKRFDPPLKKINNNAVKSLMNLDKHIFV